MQTSDFLMLLGGLALFLYGMQMMSNGLEAAAGNRMKAILEKLTSGRIRGVLDGLKMGQEKNGVDVLKETAQLEQRIDDFTDIMRSNHLKRMINGQSPADVGILFAEMVTDFERIGDHALNIAEEYSVIA